MNSLRARLIAFGIGATLLIWTLVVLAISRLPQDETNEEPPRVNTPAIPQSTEPQPQSKQEQSEPKPPQQEANANTRPAPNKPDVKTDEPPAKPPEQKEEQPSRSERPLPIQKIFASSESISSPNDKLPYGLEVTIQTTTTISPVHFRVVCSGPIGSGREMFAAAPNAGVSTSVTFGGFRSIIGNVFEFGFEMPPLTPRRPLSVKLYSATKISLVRVELVD